jgi:hypothetical protein
MSIGLRLEGRRPTSAPAAFLERVARWLTERDDEPRPRVTTPEHDLLAADLHPGAEPMLVQAPSSEAVIVSASTGTAGPGYHRHVCELARALGEAFGIKWTVQDDSSGYFATGDGDALEQAALDWVGSVLREVRELADRGVRGIALFMPAGHAYEHGGSVASVLGPRDEAWLRRAAADPRAAVDIFPWWHEGRGGRYYLDLARVHMWLDVRWRAPLDDDERALLDRVATWVERAHAMDPELPIPWDEQAEILALMSEESLRATRAQLKAQTAHDPLAPRAPIGYRRRPVRVTLSGGWTMRIPGELAERWDERGTWVAWDERRSIWFTSMTVQTAPGQPVPSTAETLAGLPALTGDEVLELERGELRSIACFVEAEHEGEPIHRLEAHTAYGPHAAIGTIVLRDESDREWALETWGSLARER